MKPPIFGINLSGTEAQQYLHRARMFKAAAAELVDYTNGEPNWPKYALVTPAIELALKAFIKHSEINGVPAGKQPANHDLLGWYKLAVQYGLKDDPEIADNVLLLNELHFGHFTRYPQRPSGPIPEASTIAGATVEHSIFTFTQSIYPRQFRLPYGIKKRGTPFGNRVVSFTNVRLASTRRRKGSSDTNIRSILKRYESKLQRQGPLSPLCGERYGEGPVGRVRH